jgi:hypothetical protein
MSGLNHKEEKDITELFHINMHVKNTKLHALFYSSLQANLIETNLVRNIGLEVHYHPNPYP